MQAATTCWIDGLSFTVFDFNYEPKISLNSTLYSMCIMVINIWTNVSSIYISKERKAAKSIKTHPAATQVLGPVIR